MAIRDKFRLSSGWRGEDAGSSESPGVVPSEDCSVFPSEGSGVVPSEGSGGAGVLENCGGITGPISCGVLEILEGSIKPIVFRAREVAAEML